MTLFFRNWFSAALFVWADDMEVIKTKVKTKSIYFIPIFDFGEGIYH